MAKPVLQSIPTFDATQNCTITFTYNGIIAKVKALIYDSTTGQVVFGQNYYYTTQKAVYVLPANSISNSSNQYYLKLQVTDNDGSVSTVSDAYQFYCKSTPVLSINGITYGDINTIKSQSYDLQFTYASVESENEYLDHFTVYLYNGTKSQIDASDSIFDISNHYVISNLEQSSTYFVRAIGITQSNIQIDTGYIELYVDYSSIMKYSKLSASNRYRYGDIIIQTDMIAIDGDADWMPVGYINGIDDAGGAIVIPQGSTITYSEGFALTGDIVCTLIMKPSCANCMVCKMTGTTETYEFYIVSRMYNEDTSEKMSCFIRCYKNGYPSSLSYNCVSNYITYDNGFVAIQFKRQSGYMESKLENITTHGGD